jgi:hypothetical protein
VRSIAIVILALAALTLLQASTSNAQVINEFVANHTGSDTNEYYEVKGQSNTDYSNLTVVEIEGDSGQTGLIDDGTFTVGTTNAEGYWCTDFLANVIENGTASFLLVEGYTGTLGDDIDTNDDGVIDMPYWTSIVDAIAVNDGGAGDLTYGGVELTPDFDGQTFTVGGASRIPDGTDTDSPGDWVRNDFDGDGLPGFTGTLAPGEASNTPCAMNTYRPVATAKRSFGAVKAMFDR